ncbi:SRPBCC domain-containing protein [Ferruginibacter paludis]|uniref:SRPBCC domain-containing protein n=1 Tax=Ferruginibacter paludis TaxID=1310417 RepID=UPI0025B3ADDD|nr:SRPBCC domain-containing protein [Ferruginibacter paludis]MDN3657865.1 SRPBCC domain-containing protein [Ferruginibacter paludis]
MENLVVKNNIIINAPAVAVWGALINPEQTKKYMFGCKTVSDWKVGSPLLWSAMYEGKETVFVKGTIVDIVPQKLLKYTVIDPNATMADIPENYLNVTYELSGPDGEVNLTVTQDGFEGAADGEKRYQDVYNNGDGWNPILVQIKGVAESAL